MAASNYAIIPAEEIRRMNELTPAAFRLLSFLRLCRNSTTGKCCPSLALCAEAIDVHPKNVFRVRRELFEKGFLEFKGDDVIFLISIKSSKNATVDIESKEDMGAVAKTLPDGSENATTVAKTLPELQKRYPMVAKTLPDGSENATAYKEEHSKEHAKEQPTAAGAHARENAPKPKPAAADLRATAPFEPEVGVDPALTVIQAMTAAVLDRYRTGGGTTIRAFEARVAEQVGQMLAMGATLETLAAFFRQRRKLPGLRYLADDWQEWAANLNHLASGAAIGGGAHLGRNGKPMLINPDSLTTKTRRNAYAIQEWIEEGSND